MEDPLQRTDETNESSEKEELKTVGFRRLEKDRILFARLLGLADCFAVGATLSDDLRLVLREGYPSPRWNIF
jgi:hypothetical protein